MRKFSGVGNKGLGGMSHSEDYQKKEKAQCGILNGADRCYQREMCNEVMASVCKECLPAATYCMFIIYHAFACVFAFNWCCC